MNFSIPAYLSNFSALDDKRTIAKLKVFYVGETGDGRVFDKEFSEKLVQSLPYTPVVAFYSDLKDDFIGHNTTQYIYGIVREDADFGFETDEDGVEWLVTEVMLYTDRIDNIGEVAKKIVGCKHSLEMDPGSVKYEVFKEEGKTKILFKEARLCGLSVLGEEQQPAFSGSEFFEENEDLRERFENFFSFLTNKDRGAVMDKNEILAQYVNFIRLTYTEKQRMVGEYASTQYGDEYLVYIQEMDDSYVVLSVMSWMDYSTTYKKFNYSIDDQGVSLSDERTCYPRYLTIEEIEKMDSGVFSSTVETKEFVEEKDEKDPEEVKEEKEDESNCVEDKDEEKEDEVEDKEDEEDDKEVYVTAEQDTSVTNSTFTEGEVNELQEEKQLQKEVQENFASNTSELSSSEREELEAFRQEKRLNLVNSYKDDLPAEQIASFLEMAKEANYEELEAKLAIAYRKFSKENKVNRSAAVFSFNNDFLTGNNKPAEQSYADLVRATLNK